MSIETVICWRPDNGENRDDGQELYVNSLSSDRDIAEIFAERVWSAGDPTAFMIAVHREGAPATIWDVDVVPVPTFEIRRRP